MLDSATATRVHMALGVRFGWRAPVRPRRSGWSVGRLRHLRLAGRGHHRGHDPAPPPRRWSGSPGRLDEVVAAARAGGRRAALAPRVAAALGPRLPGGDRAAGRRRRRLGRHPGLDVFSDVLLVFAGVALFVAVFLIFNTFSILLAQRARELALLRCLGALPAPGRHLCPGRVAGHRAAGLGARGRGRGGCWPLASADSSRRSASTSRPPPPVVEVRTVVVSLVVGHVATVGAALVPAVARLAHPTGRRHPRRPARRRRTSRALATGHGDDLWWCWAWWWWWPPCMPAAAGRRRRHPGRGGRGRAGPGLPRALGPDPAGRPPAGRRARLAVRRLARRARPSGPAQRHAPPPAHGRHRGGAHDRAHPGHDDRRLRPLRAGFDRRLPAERSPRRLRGDPARHRRTSRRGWGARLAPTPQLRRVAVLESEEVQIELRPPTAPGAPRQAGATGTEVGAYGREVTVRPAAGRLSDVDGDRVAVTTGIADTWHLHVGSAFPLGSTQVARTGYTVAAIIHDPTGLTGDVLFSSGGLSVALPRRRPPRPCDLGPTGSRGGPGVGAGRGRAGPDPLPAGPGADQSGASSPRPTSSSGRW